MTQGLQLGPIDRPDETHIPSVHWWRRIGEVISVLERIDERQENANSFKLAIDEKSGSQANVTIVAAQSQTTNPAIITGVIAYSSAATAVLAIGDTVFTIPQGLWIQTGLAIIRRNAAPTTLTSTGGAGTMFVEVMGYEQPRMTI